MLENIHLDSDVGFEKLASQLVAIQGRNDFGQEEAEQILGKFIDIRSQIKKEIDQENRAPQLEKLMQLYNTLVGVNNHVYAYLSRVPISKGEIMDQMIIPTVFTIFRRAISDAMLSAGERKFHYPLMTLDKLK